MGLTEQSLFNIIMTVTVIIQTMILFKTFKRKEDIELKNDIKLIRLKLEELNIKLIKETTKSHAEIKSIWRYVNRNGSDMVN